MPQITSADMHKLSQLQQEFNQKTVLIDQLKQELAARHESVSLAQKRIEKELRPIIEQQLERRVELVKLLDEAFALPFFSYREKEKLAALIEQISFDLIANYERRDMVEIHDKYAEFTYKEKTAYTQESAQELDEDTAADEPYAENSLDDYE
ncbi:MAG: J domain-containing protein, partial [Hymenobacteraceae bacterium]|nr:J domain-containing protein [Hymenobacteraceae bacterium]